MKTQTMSNNKNRFRTIIAGLTLSTAFLLGQVANAQSVKFADNAAIHTQTTDEFKVAVYPVTNLLIMKVHFENPSREKVTVLIKNSDEEIVYRKVIGNTAIFNGKFDVSEIANGTYTMIIQSANQTYSNPFYLETSQERIARAL